MVLIVPQGILPTPYPITRAPIELVIGVLVSGMVGYILSVYQLFLFGKYNWDFRKKIHNLGTGLAGH